MVKSATKPLKKTWNWAKPLTLTALEAVTKLIPKRPTILGSNADQSYRGVAGR